MIFRDDIKKDIKERNIRPKLVGFLANNDPAAAKYAEWTEKTCAETGVEFELCKVDKQDLEESIDKANEDKSINGIMVYYPVFGGKQVSCIFCTMLLYHYTYSYIYPKRIYIFKIV
jgi:methylenetetrahydrofolate dehydrogenase (NAD+)